MYESRRHEAKNYGNWLADFILEYGTLAEKKLRDFLLEGRASSRKSPYSDSLLQQLDENQWFLIANSAGKSHWVNCLDREESSVMLGVNTEFSMPSHPETTIDSLTAALEGTRVLVKSFARRPGLRTTPPALLSGNDVRRHAYGPRSRFNREQLDASWRERIICDEITQPLAAKNEFASAARKRCKKCTVLGFAGLN